MAQQAAINHSKTLLTGRTKSFTEPRALQLTSNLKALTLSVEEPRQDKK
jgi:hypothetical protein